MLFKIFLELSHTCHLHWDGVR